VLVVEMVVVVCVGGKGGFIDLLHIITTILYVTLMQTYRDLLVWQKGIELCESIYVISREFPREELYGLTTQIRRAAVSVPSNIAEGSGRTTRGEFVQSVGHRRGSLFEVETQLLVAQRVSYLCKEQIQPLLVLTDEIGRLSSGLIRSLSTA
jgi:four helix bundle protein